MAISVYYLSAAAKNLFLQGRLGTRSVSKQFWDFPNIFLFSRAVSLTGTESDKLSGDGQFFQV